MATGVVREWNGEDGWGVLDSDETPGGCWVHYSSLDMAGYRTLRPGQHVSFTFETGSQDGYDYRAETVWLEGVPRALPPEDGGTPLGSSVLVIRWHDTR